MRTYGIGRLVRDPEVHASADGKKVVRFSVAVDREYKREGGPTADFYNCVAFGHNADFVSKYFSKGRKIFIDGHLQSDKYTNKEGQNVYSIQIVVDRVKFADSKKTDEQPQVAEQPAMPEIEEEMPFN